MEIEPTSALNSPLSVYKLRINLATPLSIEAYCSNNETIFTVKLLILYFMKPHIAHLVENRAGIM